MLSDTLIQWTDCGDGSAEFTLSFADEDYRFSAVADGDEARLSYDETLSWRGEIRTSPPEEDVFKELMQSDEMTEFLTEYGLERVVRDDR